MSTFANILRKYGDEALLCGDEEKTVKCFIQPVEIKSRGDVFDRGAAGVRDTSEFYGFFPPEAEADKYRYLSCEGREYEILRAESFRAPGGISHWEALLKIRPEV